MSVANVIYSNSENTSSEVDQFYQQNVWLEYINTLLLSSSSAPEENIINNLMTNGVVIC